MDDFRRSLAGSACLLVASAPVGCTHTEPTHVDAAASPAPPVVSQPEAPTVPSPIELGKRLFVPGSSKLEATSTSSIDAKLEALPVGAKVRIEVFAEGRAREIAHAGSDAPVLSQKRAEVMRSYLEAKGFVVTDAVGRGYDVVDGRKPDRRVMVFLVD